MLHTYTFISAQANFSTRAEIIQHQKGKFYFLQSEIRILGRHFEFLQERGTPPLRPPPRPQAKTCPPISRVFKRRQELFAAQAVSFKNPGEDESLTASPFPTSAHYEPTNKASYFEQVRRNPLNVQGFKNYFELFCAFRHLRLRKKLAQDALVQCTKCVPKKTGNYTL